MPFATTDDIAARLGRNLTAGEVTSVELLIPGAQAVIATAAGQDDDWATALAPVPGAVRSVCVEVVCRALANPQGLDSMQEQLGQHSTSVRFRDVGLWLTRDERRLVRRAVNGYALRTVTLETPYSGDSDDDELELPL